MEHNRQFYTKNALVLLLLSAFITGCYPTPGPDKTIAGSILGAGWGAGAGAVVGNQFSDPTNGAAIGSGFGAVSGLLEGAGMDIAESHELEQQRELDALKVHVAANEQALVSLQRTLDERAQNIETCPSITQVFFDESKATLRIGTATQLERMANRIKSNPFVGIIEIHGHAEDLGDADINKRLSEARARTVAAFLMEHGISRDQLKLVVHGAKQPVVESDPQGLNRRVEIVINK